MEVVMSGIRHGIPPAQWDAAKREAKDILIARAKLRGKIAYSELVERLTTVRFEAHNPRLNQLLDDISSEEDAAGRGMLSAIVVHKNDDMFPGDGFFELAKCLGRDVQNKLSREKAGILEMNKIHDRYANKKFP